MDVFLVSGDRRLQLLNVLVIPAEQRIVVDLMRRAVHRVIIDENLVIINPRSYGRVATRV